MKVTWFNQTRNDLAKAFQGIGAEIGVEEGAFSEIICQSGKIKKLYAIDAWKVYSAYWERTEQKKLDENYEITKRRLASYNCEILRKFSADAAASFADESLDFVYIDANHDYKYVSEDLVLWSKKVKEGGIISGHDYVGGNGERRFYGSYGVISAVNDFANAINIPELIIYGADWLPSWSFIKVSEK